MFYNTIQLGKVKKIKFLAMILSSHFLFPSWCPNGRSAKKTDEPHDILDLNTMAYYVLGIKIIYIGDSKF